MDRLPIQNEAQHTWTEQRSFSQSWGERVNPWEAVGGEALWAGVEVLEKEHQWGVGVSGGIQHRV